MKHIILATALMMASSISFAASNMSNNALSCPSKSGKSRYAKNPNKTVSQYLNTNSSKSKSKNGSPKNGLS